MHRQSMSGASAAAPAFGSPHPPARTGTLAPTRSLCGSSTRLSGLEEAGLGYAWVWCEQQVAAAVKLIPLGQTAGQRLLLGLGAMIPAAVRAGCSLADEDLGGTAPGLGIASARRETQYTRLFRS